MKKKDKQDSKNNNRVIHVVKIMNHGGAETMIMNLYRNIDRKKVQFDFLCLDDQEGEYDKEIKEMGGRIFIVPSPNNGRFKNLREIYRILKKEKVKAIHSHVSFYSGFVLMVAYLAGIKKRICHSHTTSDVRKTSVVRYFYNSLARFLIKIFANIKLSCGDKAGKYLYKKSKYTLINNGIDLEKYSLVSETQVKKLKNELGIQEDEFIIGHVGRFEKVKNQKYFINFAKSLKNRIDNFKIVLVGNGTQRESIEKQVKEENLEKYFVFPGVRDDINVFMKMFNIFLMPSLYEGFPLVVVEALAGDNVCYLSDTISKETNIVKDRVKYFNIYEKEDKLIELIISRKNDNKYSVIQELKEKGFSIKDTSQKMMRIYLDNTKG